MKAEDYVGKKIYELSTGVTSLIIAAYVGYDGDIYIIVNIVNETPPKEPSYEPLIECIPTAMKISSLSENHFELLD